LSRALAPSLDRLFHDARIDAEVDRVDVARVGLDDVMVGCNLRHGSGNAVAHAHAAAPVTTSTTSAALACILSGSG
jgi:hypothetical protein